MNRRDLLTTAAVSPLATLPELEGYSSLSSEAIGIARYAMELELELGHSLVFLPEQWGIGFEPFHELADLGFIERTVAEDGYASFKYRP